MPDGMTRRRFVQTSTAAAVAAAASAGRVLGANDRIRLGFIGVGNRGGQLLSAESTGKNSQPCGGW